MVKQVHNIRQDAVTKPDTFLSQPTAVDCLYIQGRTFQGLYRIHMSDCNPMSGLILINRNIPV